jgi:hypothetical protein
MDHVNCVAIKLFNLVCFVLLKCNDKSTPINVFLFFSFPLVQSNTWLFCGKVITQSRILDAKLYISVGNFRNIDKYRFEFEFEIYHFSILKMYDFS